ncbi:hypothetical protein [Brevibacillus centrosporus]|uniref:hypothetical protein n=1 Tax=Brevibacillus centrosporus TaxID=54910 RepID=UPI002E21E1D8|nr:hypothetical protein [Brevibacillus centrosporus]
MSEQENKSVLVDRSKKKESYEQKEQSETVTLAGQAYSTNHALASQFPEWDLKPPTNLVKRRSSRWA